MNLSGRHREDLPSVWVGTIQLAAENSTEGVLLSPTLKRDTLFSCCLGRRNSGLLCLWTEAPLLTSGPLGSQVF